MPYTISPNTISLIPLDQIDQAALTRDRSVLDQAALDELAASIRQSGLRLPVELFDLDPPRPPLRFGLISGYRRLHVFRELSAELGDDRFSAIPAIIRPRGSLAQAMAEMIEENTIRAELSAWEQGRIALIARNQDLFPSIEEAVEGLYPRAGRNKRSRLRALARLVERLEGHLTEPERLSLRQCLRLAAAIERGYGEVIYTALTESRMKDADSQWHLIRPILAEAEDPGAKAPPLQNPGRRPRRPRLVSRPRHSLTIRRERTSDGYCLHFTGREARGALIDDILDEIERKFGVE